jgi:membrane-associated phospholipid phosphatase
MVMRLMLQVIWLALPLFAFTQPKFSYQFNIKTELGILLPATGGAVAGWALDRAHPGLSPKLIEGLNTENIRWNLDRRATKQWSPRMAHRSDWLLYGAMLTPTALALIPANRSDAQGRVVALMGFETLYLTYGLTSFTKNLVRRPRPFTYNPEVPLSLKTNRDARQSFFSGHSSMSAAACVFTAQVFSDRYPNSPWRPVVWAGAVALPATVAWHRYKAGKHFASDVLVGLAVGAACGWLVPRWHRSR